MSSLLSLLLNTNFWIALNLILLSAIIGLVYHRYIMVKRQTTVEKIRDEYDEIRKMIGFFENLLNTNMREKAVIYGFNRLMTFLGATRYPDKTYKEILLHNMLNLSNYKKDRLMEMYSIYEKIRFSDAKATDEEIERFRNLLYSIIKYSQV